MSNILKNQYQSIFKTQIDYLLNIISLVYIIFILEL